MDFDKETQEQIQELQANDQIFQQLMMQKQAFQVESTETEAALAEIEKTQEDIFKIVGGQIMVKKSKKDVQEELKKKQELIKLRLDSIEKQEKTLVEITEKLKEQVMKKLNPAIQGDSEPKEEKEDSKEKE